MLDDLEGSSLPAVGALGTDDAGATSEAEAAELEERLKLLGYL